MRRFLLTLGLLVAGFASTHAAESPADFQQGNAAYEAGEFREAREAYEAVVKSGDYSAKLFYNLGNAAFRLNDFGVAILNYERALALSPGDPEARANLTFTRDRTGAKLPPGVWHDYVYPAWNLSTFAVLTAITGWALVLVLAAGFFRLIPRSTGQLSAMALALAAAYFTAGFVRTRGDREMAIVVAKQSTARYAPAESSTVAETLPPGSRVRVLLQRGDWIYCALPNAGTGWISAGSIERVRK